MGTVPKRSRNKKMSRSSPKRLAIIYGIILIATAICALIAAKAVRHDTSLTDPFPAGQHQTAGFDLYYPARLPLGYSIEKPDRTLPQSTVVTLRILDNPVADTTAIRSITISQQRSSPDFNFRTFLGSFADKSYVKTELGQATIGTIDDGNTHIASLVTRDGTWILVNASANVPAADIEFILQHLVLSEL